MKGKDALRLGLLILLLGMMAGCARLPEYARPRFQDPAHAAVIDQEGFRYRTLTVEDFQAEALPPDYNRYHHHIHTRGRWF